MFKFFGVMFFSLLQVAFVSQSMAAIECNTIRQDFRLVLNFPTVKLAEGQELTFAESDLKTAKLQFFLTSAIEKETEPIEITADFSFVKARVVSFQNEGHFDLFFQGVFLNQAQMQPLWFACKAAE